MNNNKNIEKSPVSYHIFLLPFRWDIKSNSKGLSDITFNDRTNLTEIKEILTKNNWVSKVFSVDKNHVNYNISSYYYDFVFDAIVNEKKDENNSIKDNVILNFEYDKKVCVDPLYIIKVKGNEKRKEATYSLTIDKINLDIYNCGIGILSFHLSNTDQNISFDDVLNINEFGRRIYPQFLKEKGNVETKKTFLADEITLKINDQPNYKWIEDFTSFEKIPNQPFVLPKYIKELLGVKFKTNENELNEKDVLVKWLVDDRMFVLCWYGDYFLSNKICQKIKAIHDIEYQYNYFKSEDWYKFNFIDTSEPTCQNVNMLETLNKKHTYDRWADYNTLYGVTRYSFVCLTDNYPNLEKNKADFVLEHMKGIYFHLVSLCLAQRSTVLRFSYEVTRISSIEDKKTEVLADLCKQINEEYLKFVNKMYFREVTAQEQGIELYDKLQEVMRIEHDVKTLSKEIKNLYQFVDLLVEKSKSEKINKIQFWAAIFAIFSLITGVFGMNFFSQPKDGLFSNFNTILQIVAIVLFGFLSIILIQLLRKKFN